MSEIVQDVSPTLCGVPKTQKTGPLDFRHIPLINFLEVHRVIQVRANFSRQGMSNKLDKHSPKQLSYLVSTKKQELGKKIQGVGPFGTFTFKLAFEIIQPLVYDRPIYSLLPQEFIKTLHLLVQFVGACCAHLPHPGTLKSFYRGVLAKRCTRGQYVLLRYASVSVIHDSV
jgi:hypothetical protein